MSESIATTANETYSNKDHNYTILQAFEWYAEGDGKHWDAICKLIPKLSDFGITALWIPPPTKAASQGSVGYDVYDLFDLGEFDQKGGRGTKWGTKEQLINTIKTARKHGIVTYVDAILNHRFGADRVERFLAVQVENHDRTKEISGQYTIEGWTAFDFPGRINENQHEIVSNFKWNYNHFTGVDYNNDSRREGIFCIIGENKYWAQAVDREHKNYDYLMGADIQHSHPDARSDIIKWGKWIIDEVDACGFWFDAVKHIDRNFIADFIKTMCSETGKPDLFALGEFWKDSFDDLSNYVNALGTQFSVFDVPLHYNFKEAGDSGNNFNMQKIWDGSIVECKADQAVTFVDNHDTQPGQSLESWVSPSFKPLAYALILLRPAGYPCVFWGDLYGTKEKDPRQPMSQLADFVRACKLFAYGEVRDHWDHSNCIGWVRTGDGENGRDGCAVLMCNGDEGYKKMEVGKEHAGEKWTDVLQWHHAEVVIGGDGWGMFKCPARSVSIWVKNDAKGREQFQGN